MAAHTVSPVSAPSAQVIGNAFIEQYYHILHHSPELAFRFYQETSLLTRPDPNGLTTTVTTMKRINDQICSMDYKNYEVEIKTADAQESYNGGVIVLVTGYLTIEDNLRREFSQTFFLAPQEKGFYVSNDVFRYLEENEPDIGVHETSSSSFEPNPESAQVAHSTSTNDASSQVHGIETIEGTIDDQVVEEGKTADDSDKIGEADPHLNKCLVSIAESSTSVDLDIVPESKDTQYEVEGHSIYIRNLPLNVTVSQLEAEFQKFGVIKPNGVQVRYNNQLNSCFGFVEFQEFISMQSAAKASPVSIGDRQVAVEIKRTTNRVGSGRGLLTPPHGGYHYGGRANIRSGSFRGRGNGHNGEGYRQGRGRGGRRFVPTQISAST